MDKTNKIVKICREISVLEDRLNNPALLPHTIYYITTQIALLDNELSLLNSACE